MKYASVFYFKKRNWLNAHFRKQPQESGTPIFEGCGGPGRGRGVKIYSPVNIGPNVGKALVQLSLL